MTNRKELPMTFVKIDLPYTATTGYWMQGWCIDWGGQYRLTSDGRRVRKDPSGFWRVVEAGEEW